MNVIAAIARIATPDRTSPTMRATSAAVLPVPAPASTNSVSASSLRIAIRAASSLLTGSKREGCRSRHSIAPVSVT